LWPPPQMKAPTRATMVSWNHDQKEDMNKNNNKQ
jgi:hypothetical protein